MPKTFLIRNWPLVTSMIGILLAVAGLSYEIIFAGIPYQDPTPEILNNYHHQTAIAQRIYTVAYVFCLIGALSLFGKFIHREITQRKRPKL